MFQDLIIHNEWIRNLAGIALTIWGLCDGIKYSIEAKKIKACKTSIGHSRKFINLAISNDLYRLFYFVFIDQNAYLLVSSALALCFMVEMFWAMYIYYPYETYPKRITVKRPNILVYLWNSLLPNTRRPRL